MSAGRRRPHAAPRAVAIHIDVVRLEGITLTSAQTRQFQGALQAELERLATLRDRPQAWSSATVEAERAPQLVLQPSHHATQLGVEVGRSLWAAIEGVK